ncbi:MAG TPA: pantoate--beta-alanine ligase [Polyangiaceae bacterium]|jgi:pantoate--beta-alanine ligase
MTLSIVQTPAELRSACDQVRSRGDRVGFVPTMGALHAGHLALVAEAARHARFVVASIFVNPTQFGPGEDFTRYPRDLEGDVRKLAEAGAHLVFAPAAAIMYSAGESTRVRVSGVTEPLEGAHRPGHFEGVATVVAKLFSAVGPCTAVFGRKDYQQLLVVRRMTTDLMLPVVVVGHPIVREPDGLAMSSRNAYLSAEERVRALAIVRSLAAAFRRFAGGDRDPAVLEGAARAVLEPSATSIDYVAVRDAESLAQLPVVRDRAVLAVACRVGKTRLIDNTVLGEDSPPPGGPGAP